MKLFRFLIPLLLALALASPATAALPDIDPEVSYTATGSATSYTFLFKVFEAEDLTVTVDGEEKTLGSDYTVTGAGNDAGGTVTFTTAPPSGEEVVITRTTPLDRKTDYTTGGPLRAKTLNDDIDRVVAQLQENGGGLNRALKFPRFDPADPTLPDLDTRKGKILGFDGTTGKPIPITNPVSVGDFKGLTAETYAELRLIDTTGLTENTQVLVAGRSVAGDGGEGHFRWVAGDQSANVTADTQNGIWVPGTDGTGVAGAWKRQSAYVTPEMFGAIGNGVADDNAELQAYFDISFSGAKTAKKGATYKITSLTISNSNQIDMNGASITCAADNASKLLVISGDDVLLSNAIFNHQNTSYIGAALDVTGSNITIDGCTFMDVCEYSLVVNSLAVDINLLNNVFDKSDQTSFNIVCQGKRVNIRGNRVLNGDAGVVINGPSSDVIVSGNFIRNVAEVGIDVIGTPSSNVIITNNLIENCPLGGARIGTSGAGGYYGKNVIIKGNRIINCGSAGAHSIDVTGDGSTDPNVLITANHITGHDSSASCIILTNAPDSIISNNYCTNGNFGVYLNVGSKRVIVTGNKTFLNRIDGIKINMGLSSPNFDGTISNNIIYSNGTTNDGSGVNIQYGNNTNITGNTIFEPLTTGKKQQKGIWFQDNATRCGVHENTIYGNDIPVQISVGSTSGYNFGNNYDNSGKNITRARANVGLSDGLSSVSVTYNLLFNPTNYQISTDSSDHVWVSSKGSSGATFSRSGTTGTTVIYYDIGI